MHVSNARPTDPRPPRAEAPPLRADALRNREAVIAAAREVFAAQGLDAPLDEIARRAGVGNATLYRRFSTRQALIEAVFADGLSTVLRAGERARGAEDAWAGLTALEEEICTLLVTDHGAKDLLTTGIRGIPTLDALKQHNLETVTLLVHRAQRQGTMRTDVTPEDLLVSLGALCAAVPALSAAAPDAWRRYLALLLDGFRAEGAHPLPAPTLTPAQLDTAMQELAAPMRA
ncbi:MULTISPECIES: TetR/AcrR family transcriptional regulator [Streptacidiphilus]|uniref:TetR/AcrR family transcriptional regulator n=1 Tax=Streptacidiphilus cavernicola TaxID=3342716 RepID=A0ABV6UTY5_9ACTN|nr:helix-turn-helix domain-containing protein [Streptacidiphilus jeojiense]